LAVSNEVMRAGLSRAIQDPYKLTMLGLSSMGAAVVHSWAFLGVAAVCYLAALAVDLRRREFWRSVLRDLRRRSPVFPDLDSIFDGESRMLLARLRDASEELARTPALHGEDRAPLRERIVSLERRAVALLAAIQSLDQYLSTHPRSLAERELTMITGRPVSDDPRVERERDWQRRAAERKLASLRHAELERRRLAAHLHATTAALDATRCHLARPTIDGELLGDEDRRELLAALDELADPQELDVQVVVTESAPAS
jgi:hypothetical protein